MMARLHQINHIDLRLSQIAHSNLALPIGQTLLFSPIGFGQKLLAPTLPRMCERHFDYYMFVHIMMNSHILQ